MPSCPQFPSPAVTLSLELVGEGLWWVAARSLAEFPASSVAPSKELSPWFQKHPNLASPGFDHHLVYHLP